MRSFQDGFKRARKAAGYTQKSFAEEYGCGLETVRTWEQGRHTPSLSEMDKLCKFFDCSFGYLMGETNIKTQDEKKRIACEYTGLSEQSVEMLELAASRFVVNHLLLQIYDPTPRTDGELHVKMDGFKDSVIIQLRNFFLFDFASADTDEIETAGITDGKNYLYTYLSKDIIERACLEDIIRSLKELNREIHRNRTNAKRGD